MQRAVALGKPLHNLELIYALPDGRLIFAFGNAAPLFDGNGKVRGSVAAFLDITERKRADEERAKLQEQLAQAHKMEAIGTLAGGIAHDFNNILWAIMGYTELTMGSIPGGSKEHRNLQQILIASERARDLVNQILAFSRKAAQERKPLQLSLIVKETLKLLRATIPTTIDLKQEIASPNAMVLADSTQIHQLIMNLCTNSTQAMREKGDTLKIGLEEKDLDEDGLLEHPDLSPGPYVILIISDNGPGIAPEIIDRIFDPFFTTKEVGEGTGMGLAVVYGIVKSHGGGISVYSQPEAGTTFTVLLPKILNPESESKEVDTSIPQGCGHLLVIDDEKMLVDLTKKMLERLGYEVTASNSSLEALKIFQAQPDKFDLVITDQTMPHMTGMQLARQLRRIRPDIPIILCTGYSETVSEEKVIATGINKLLMKPVIMRRLAEAAREALEGIGDGPPSFAGVEK
jgi:signal transduction histidine kinase/CheY-like chemotaxis protein